jgi:hypothetical protein
MSDLWLWDSKQEPGAVTHLVDKGRVTRPEYAGRLTAEQLALLSGGLPDVAAA